MIMKKVMLFLISISFTLNVLSQEKKNQLNFSIGPSFAIGNFGDESASIENSGSAGIGADLYLFYGHKFTKNIGIGIKWFGNSNVYKNDQYVGELEEQTGVGWTSETSYWSLGGFLIGMTGHIPTHEKIVVDFRILVGYPVLSSPESKVTQRSQPSIWYNMESSSARGFGYNIGTGLSYFFHPKWCVTVNLDYIGAGFRFQEIYIYDSNGHLSYFHDSRQPVALINTTVGIGFNF
jgi:hypothetical protein